MGLSDDEIEEYNLYMSHVRLMQYLNKSCTEESAVFRFCDESDFPAIEDFPPGLEWFNVSESLSLSQHLNGKIVILDFWTYCCINCMHVLPELKEIEEEFSIEKGVVVIGVHSAKFANEKLSSNILSAVQRYNITHPVVNDHNCEMWRKCDIQCWPTVMVLDPLGRPLLMLLGEGHKDLLLTFIRYTTEYYKQKGHLSNHKLPIKSAFHLLPDLKGPLLFPGKITSYVDDTREILAVSDTGNHRILILNPDGTIIQEIGGQKAGWKDGDFKDALFNTPQGLAFRNSRLLYVADTENHLIREIDFDKETVNTVAGTGEPSEDRHGGKIGTLQSISSPWDVCIYKTKNMKRSAPAAAIPPLKPPVPPLKPPEIDLFSSVSPTGTESSKNSSSCANSSVSCKRLDESKNDSLNSSTTSSTNEEVTRDNTKMEDDNLEKDVLLIAMAGKHQIWALFFDDIIWWKDARIERDTCMCIAGSGTEENRNNRFPRNAGFAQPSGLSVCNERNEVYIADSESSTVRKMSLLDGQVLAVVGGDKNPTNLFAYGDLDGVGSTAKLQHVLGVAVSPDQSTLFVADSYNHKIKKVDIAKNAIITICGNKQMEINNASSEVFNEPGGLCIGSNNKIYIADTNNHAIKVIDLNYDYSVKNISKLELKSLPSEKEIKFDDNIQKIFCNPVAVNQKGGKIIFNVILTFEGNLKLNEEAPQKWIMHLPSNLWSSVPNNGSQVENLESIISVSPTASSKDNLITVIFKVYTCSEKVCLPVRNFVLSLPIEFKNDADMKIEHKICLSVEPNKIKLC